MENSYPSFFYGLAYLKILDSSNRNLLRSCRFYSLLICGPISLTKELFVGSSKSLKEAGDNACKITHIHTYITYIQIHTRIQTYMHAYKLTYIHTNIHTCIHTFIHAYMHTCIYTFKHTYIYTCIHTYIHAVIHSYMHSCIHTFIHTCIHAFKHTCMHTYIRTILLSLNSNNLCIE